MADVGPIDPAAARAVVVDRQGFAARARTASVAEAGDVIRALGCVQLDSVSTVGRAHLLTLAARVGRVTEDDLNELRRSGRVFEHWAHEACLIPVDDWGVHHHRMVREHPWWGAVLAEHADVAERVLADIAEHGPRSPRDYGGGGGGWWDWTPVKKVFESLWTAGELAVRERRGFERIYDLAERVIPAELRSAPLDEDEAMRALVRRTVAARGIVTRGRVHDYFRIAGGQRACAGAVDALLDAGELHRGMLGDLPVVLDEDAAGLLEEPPSPRTPVLLCPFDNLVWDREETRRLFGFDHRLEIYVPAERRRWGYYVLPLLAGDRVVARVDAKADRKAGVLRALAVHWEGRAAWGALERAHARLAAVLRLEPGPLAEDEA